MEIRLRRHLVKDEHIERTSRAKSQTLEES